MKGVIYQGEPVSDAATFARLPLALQNYLLQCNGLLAYQGGLHLRGCCQAPAWHSLRHAWEGETALSARYQKVRPTDIPFAEDYAGNQFLLRGEEVVFLDAETGEIAYLQVDFEKFIAGVEKFPQQALGLELLISYLKGGGHLRPGELLSIQPPQCVEAPNQQRTLRPQPTAERLAFLADFYRQIRNLPDGQALRISPSSDQ
ncbi:SMI1/KNR4 family protein [Hymenobacter aerilatus]|uniref:SMI1/KNR4 family protein n=1 Tax=Hymenobacter aerilatus TaxID=2932251 RepID=A0A8T9SNA3_9BACT|nr:SMI1/KNR4 family protein [Hymenobacter aerilatus]UOR03522.1 SMI1/KNR4 family protein [Hymenobacter aerilatus]